MKNSKKVDISKFGKSILVKIFNAKWNYFIKTLKIYINDVSLISKLEMSISLINKYNATIINIITEITIHNADHCENITNNSIQFINNLINGKIKLKTSYDEQIKHYMSCVSDIWSQLPKDTKIQLSKVIVQLIKISIEYQKYYDD